MARTVRIRSKYKGPFNFVDGLQVNGVPVGTGGGDGGGPTSAKQVSIEPIDSLTAENVQDALAELTTRAGTDASVPNATQSTPGIVELATALETSTGADGSRAVSPLTLKPLLDAKAPVSHSHTGYASDTHTHAEYAATSHTHSIANVVNLTTALNSKADSSHAHTEYAATSHGHAIANITGLETALSGKADSNHTHTGYATTGHAHVDYAPLASPTFTGTPAAPTAAANTNTTQVATTAFVTTALSGIGIADATTAVAGKVMLASAGDTTSTNKAVTPAILNTAVGGLAASNHTHSEYASASHSHGIMGVSGLTEALADKANIVHTHAGYAQTDHVHSDYATLNSPTFTGAPTAPTPAASDDSTKIATTAYVQAELSQFTPSSSGTIATQETVNAGVNNTETVTPLTLHTKLNQAVYTNRYNANISVLAADTPVSINHNLNLANKYGFVINTVHQDKTVNLEVKVIDNNTITLTSLIGLTNVYVTIIGAMDANQLQITSSQLTALTGDMLYGRSILDSTQQVNSNRYLINDAGVLKCNGIPVREIGVCLFSTLTDYHLTGSDEFLTELPKVSKEGFRFIRVNSSALFAPDWNTVYVNDKAGFLKRVKQFLDVANDNNIGVIMSLFWRYATIPDLVSERVNIGLGTPGSATRNFCAQYVQDLVDTFKNHPAIAGWEMGNEYSLFASNGALPHINVGLGTPASYSIPDDVMTLETMRSFYSFIIAEIKKYDTTNRIIMSGNGGPGGVIEKSLSNYLTLLPLDNPMDNWTFHKYSRNFFGSRAYADLKNTLIEIRNAAYAAGKPMILGEFGQERNELYGGYGGTNIFKNGADAVYRSGTQLAFAWNWKREDSLVETNDFSFHPENTINGTNEVFKILQYYNEKMKSEGYIPPNVLQPTLPVEVSGNGGYGTGTTVTVANHASLNQDKGFAISLRIKMTRADLSNRKIVFKYGSSVGWFIGYGAAFAANAGNVVYAQVAWADGSTLSSNGQTMPQKPADGWVHYLFQVNETTTDDTYGLTVFQNGIWINTIKPSSAKTFNASSGDLYFFSEAGAANAAHVGIKDVRLYNRALNDVEARNVYMYDIVPAGTVVSHWKMDGDLTDSVGTNPGTLTAGAITYGA